MPVEDQPGLPLVFRKPEWADVIAIVEWVETLDSQKRTHDFAQKRDWAVQVVTQLKPLVVLKGKEKGIDEILLIHFRLKKPPQKKVFKNLPMFAKFEKKRRYLVFLKVIPNAHSEPVTGQFYGKESVKLLPN